MIARGHTRDQEVMIRDCWISTDTCHHKQLCIKGAQLLVLSLLRFSQHKEHSGGDDTYKCQESRAMPTNKARSRTGFSEGQTTACRRDLQTIRTKMPHVLLLLAASNSQANQFPVGARARAKSLTGSALRGGSDYPEQPPFHDRRVSSGETSSSSSIQSTSLLPPPYYDHGKQPYSTISDETEDPFHETVQDRVNRWRQSQMEQLADRPNPDQAPRALTPEQQNRFRLIMSVSKGSRAFIFILLVLRSLHLFEVADQTLSGKKILRLLAVVPIFILFVGNMAGVVASLTSPSHSAKKRLKVRRKQSCHCQAANQLIFYRGTIRRLYIIATYLTLFASAILCRFRAGHSQS